MKYARALAGLPTRYNLATEQARLACRRVARCGVVTRRPSKACGSGAVQLPRRELRSAACGMLLNQVGRRDQALQEPTKLVERGGGAWRQRKPLVRNRSTELLRWMPCRARQIGSAGEDVAMRQGEQTLCVAHHCCVWRTPTKRDRRRAWEAKACDARAFDCAIARITSRDSSALIQLLRACGQRGEGASESAGTRSGSTHAQGAYEAEAGVVRSALEKDPENEELHGAACGMRV